MSAKKLQITQQTLCKMGAMLTLDQKNIVATQMMQISEQVKCVALANKHAMMMLLIKIHIVKLVNFTQQILSTVDFSMKQDHHRSDHVVLVFQTLEQKW